MKTKIAALNPKEIPFNWIKPTRLLGPVTPERTSAVRQVAGLIDQDQHFGNGNRRLKESEVDAFESYVTTPGADLKGATIEGTLGALTEIKAALMQSRNELVENQALAKAIDGKVTVKGKRIGNGDSRIDEAEVKRFIRSRKDKTDFESQTLLSRARRLLARITG